MVRTRARNYVEDDQEPEVEVASFFLPTQTVEQQETLHQQRGRWSELLHRQDYRAVITEVLEREIPKYTMSTVIDPMSLSSIVSECVLILASAPAIFTAAVDGVLTQQYPSNSSLQAEYAIIQERAHKQPSIYIHLLADEHGITPTPSQYLLVQDLVSNYIAESDSDNAIAFLIDNNSPPDHPSSASIRGLRKYLRTSSSTRSPTHVSTLRRFCAGIQNLVVSTPVHLRDTPMPFPPGECGYARNSHKRLSQHRSRQSSNYVMNLVEDICAHLYHTNQLSQKFYMHQFIIYLVFRPSQAAIAEIFISGLLQVWIDGGGGFNGYPAGRSCRSVRDVGEAVWEECEVFAVRQSRLVERVRAQMEREVEAVNEAAVVLWREVLESVGGGREVNS